MNIVNLSYRNPIPSPENNSQTSQCSEYAAFKNIHFNACKNKITKLEIVKRENHALNCIFLVGAVFFGIVFLKDHTITEFYSLFIVLFLLLATRYYKSHEWMLQVTFKKNIKARYKMMNHEKKDAMQLVQFFNIKQS